MESATTTVTQSANSDSERSNVGEAGRLKYYVNEWKAITKDRYVLQLVKGAKLPFHTKPSQNVVPKLKTFSKEERASINLSICKLLKSKAIEPSVNEPDEFISNVFVVPKQDGGFRLVIDLRELNQFIECPHFKMEDYRTACSLIRQGDYLAVVDQKEAYHAIPVHKDYQKFLKFKWNHQLYKFTCLPFGLNIAPYYFTKLMKPVLACLRVKGFLSVAFLDDTLLIGRNFQECLNNVKSTTELFTKLGLSVHKEKSVLIPKNVIKFLGFIFNTVNYTISLPEHKQNKIINLCTIAINRPKIQVQSLAEVIGVLVSACPAIPYSYLYTKQLEHEKIKGLKICNDYNAHITISDEAKQDLTWWIHNVQKQKSLIKDNYDLTVYTDASMTGWGGHTTNFNTKGWWTLTEKEMHINDLELLAIYNVIKAIPNIRGKTILLRCDNTTAISYINNFGGCRNINCHKIAKEIWKFCEMRSVELCASYIHTKVNRVADQLSRDKEDTSDFMITKPFFNQICQKIYQPTIDLFASAKTFQIHPFVSWFPTQGCYAVDAFTILWPEKFYAFPPFSLIGRVLNKIVSEKLQGIVVAPYWVGQPWFPLYKKLQISEIVYLTGDDLLFCPYFNRPHPLNNQITLMAAELSGHVYNP